jgi:hypothetical protein
VPIKEKIPKRIMGIAIKKDIPMSTATKGFVDIIKE